MAIGALAFWDFGAWTAWVADAENRLGKPSGTVRHHGAPAYLWATFAAAPAILVLLVLRAPNQASFLQSPNDRQRLAGLTRLNVSLVLLAFPCGCCPPCGAQLGWGTMRI